MIPKEMIEAAAKAIESAIKPDHQLTWSEKCARAAESALTAALSVQWRGMESAEWITGYNAGLEASARHCEYNALSAIPVEIRGLKRAPKPAP